MAGSPSVLHVGCGGDPLPSWLGKYEEIRLDIDEAHSPDIVCDMRALPEALQVDVVYCSHALEHLFPYEVVPVLAGFYRVLNRGGSVVLFVPDLEDVRATDDVLFDAPAGPICGMDLIYGYRKMLKEKPYMAHKTGFTSKTLHDVLTVAGFTKVAVLRLPDYALMGAAVK